MPLFDSIYIMANDLSCFFSQPHCLLFFNMIYQKEKEKKKDVIIILDMQYPLTPFFYFFKKYIQSIKSSGLTIPIKYT